MSQIRILLADDHAITREGTRRLFDAEADFEVIAECADGEETIRLAQELRPDILLLDISMPRLNGIQVAQVIRRTVPETRIVILTGYDNPQYAKAVESLGVAAYLSKTVSSRELIRVLRAVHAEYTLALPETASLGTDKTGSIASDGPTPKELEVLRLVAEGYRNWDIAHRLGIRERTVQFHLSNLFAKLHASSRTELVHRARQVGWLF